MNDPVVQSELEEIAAALEEEREMDQSSYADCFRFTRNKIALRTLTGIALQAWQQLTGINFISYCMYYPRSKSFVHIAHFNDQKTASPSSRAPGSKTPSSSPSSRTSSAPP